MSLDRSGIYQLVKEYLFTFTENGHFLYRGINLNTT